MNVQVEESDSRFVDYDPNNEPRLSPTEENELRTYEAPNVNPQLENVGYENTA